MYRDHSIPIRPKRKSGNKNKNLWAIFGLSCGMILAAEVAAAGSKKSESWYRTFQSGLNLPGVSRPGGYDEIRGSDGTNCRSSIAANGPFLDTGVLGAPDTQDVTVYGRVTIPLGNTPKRVNCNRLYELEVQRLKTELELLKSGGAVDTSKVPGGVW